MDLREAILEEHSKRQVLRIAAYVGADCKRFARLMNLFLSGDYRIGQRSAWVVNWCTRKHPELIVPWLKKMVLNLQREELHDAVKRNTLRVLGDVKLPEEVQGAAAEVCFRFLLSKDEAVAVKAFAMTVLGNICRQHPGLKQEVKMVIKDMLPYGTAAIKSRGSKILKQIEMM